MNGKNCTVCNIEIDEDNYKKDRNLSKICYNIKRKRYNNNEKNRKNDGSMNNIEKPKIDNVNNEINVSTYEYIGPKNVGKTYYILKILEKIIDKRPIHIITRSPNQYPISKTRTEIKPINKYNGSVVIFDDMLGARNSSEKD